MDECWSYRRNTSTICWASQRALYSVLSWSFLGFIISIERLRRSERYQWEGGFGENQRPDVVQMGEKSTITLWSTWQPIYIRTFCNVSTGWRMHRWDWIENIQCPRVVSRSIIYNNMIYSVLFLSHIISPALRTRLPCSHVSRDLLMASTS